MTSRRVRPLPPNWRRIRRRIGRRDGHTCQLGYRGCLGYTPKGGQVDHIVPAHRWPSGRPGEHDDANLQWACEPCHARKSQAENPASQPRRRPPEPHPGELPAR